MIFRGKLISFILLIVLLISLVAGSLIYWKSIVHDHADRRPMNEFLPSQVLFNGHFIKSIEVTYTESNDTSDLYSVDYYPFEYLEAVHRDIIFEGIELSPTRMKISVNSSGISLLNPTNPIASNRYIFLSLTDTIEKEGLSVYGKKDLPQIQLFDRVNYMGCYIQCYRIYNYWGGGPNLLLYIDSRRLYGVANECVNSNLESIIISYCGYIPDFVNHSYIPGSSLSCKNW